MMASSSHVTTNSTENRERISTKKKEMDYYVPPSKDKHKKSKKGKNKIKNAERLKEDTRNVKMDHPDPEHDTHQSGNDAARGQARADSPSSISSASSPEKNYSATSETPRRGRNYQHGKMYCDREPKPVSVTQRMQPQTSQDTRDKSSERRTRQSQSPQDTRGRNFERGTAPGPSPQGARDNPWKQSPKGYSKPNNRSRFEQASPGSTGPTWQGCGESESSKKRSRSSSGGPHERSRQEQRNKYCRWCRVTDHNTCDCPVPYCRVCYKTGHTYGDEHCEAIVRSPDINNVRTIKGREDILSNFYDCKVSIYGHTFHTSENAYHYRKAVICGDENTAWNFINARSAGEGKSLSKGLQSILPAGWDETKVVVMKEILQAKFEQVPEFRKDLLGTGEKILAHSLTDKYWGTGLHTEETMAMYPEYWPGQNIHGVMLTELRDKFTGKVTQEAPNYKRQTNFNRPWSRGGTPQEPGKRDERGHFHRTTPRSAGSRTGRDNWPQEDRSNRQMTASSAKLPAGSQDTSFPPVNQPEPTKQTTKTRADDPSAQASSDWANSQESRGMQQGNARDEQSCPETWDSEEPITLQSSMSHDVHGVRTDAIQQPPGDVLAPMNTQPSQSSYGPPPASVWSTEPENRQCCNQGTLSQDSVSEQDSRQPSSGSENRQSVSQVPSDVENQSIAPSLDSEPQVGTAENPMDEHRHDRTLTPEGKQPQSNPSPTDQVPQHHKDQYNRDETNPQNRSDGDWSMSKKGGGRRNRVQGGWNSDTRQSGGRGHRSHQDYGDDPGQVRSPPQGQSQGRNQPDTAQSFKGDRKDTEHQGGRGGQYKRGDSEDTRRTGGRGNYDGHDRGNKQYQRHQSQDQRHDGHDKYHDRADRRDKHGNKSYKEQDPAKRLEMFSRALSSVLRHRAKDLGFNIQTDGCIYVKELLEHPFFSKHEYSHEELRYVVHNNDKKRFLMTEDESGKLKIRANQGHTMAAMSIPMKKITDATQWADVVHGTYYDYLRDIKKKGLNRRGRNHIHFAPGEPGKDEEVISGMRGSCDVMIYIDMAAAIADGYEFFLSENNVILTAGDKDGNLPPKYFSKVLDRATRQEV